MNFTLVSKCIEQVTNGVKVRIHIQAYILEDLYLADKLGPGNQILTQTSMGPLTGRVKVQAHSSIINFVSS